MGYLVAHPIFPDEQNRPQPLTLIRRLEDAMPFPSPAIPYFRFLCEKLPLDLSAKKEKSKLSSCFFVSVNYR